MKSLLTYAFLALYVLWTLVSCTAFTAPSDPLTGIRMDIPRDEAGNKLWSDINPLDTPGTDDYRIPPSMGNFGPGWMGN